MATLPDPRRLQRVQVVDETAPLQRRVVDDGLSDVARGMSDVAGELGAAAERQLEFQAQNARAQWITGKAKLDREFKEDPGDFTTLTNRYDEKLSELADSVSGTIGSPRGQESFRNTVIVPDRENSLTRMQGYAFELEGDHGRAQTTERLSELRDVFASGSEEDARAAAEAVEGIIMSAQDARYLDEEGATNLRLKTQQDFALARIDAADPETRLDMLDQDFIREALPDDVEAKLRRQATTDRNELVAQREVDELMSSGADRSAGRRAIREKYGDDAELRAAVEKRFDYELAQQKSAEAEMRQDAQDEAERLVMEGTAVRDLPDDVRGQLTAGGLEALEEVELKALNGHPVVTDSNTYYELVDMSGTDPAKFSDLDLLAYRGKLSQSDFQSLAIAQRSMRSKGESGEYGLLKGLRNRNQVTDDVMRSIGITQKEKPEQAALFRERANELLQRYQLENDGQLPTPSEWQKTVRQLAVEVEVEKPWYVGGNDELRAFQVPPGTEVVMDVDQVPERDRALITESLERKGMTVTDDLIVRYYMKGAGLRIAE